MYDSGIKVNLNNVVSRYGPVSVTYSKQIGNILTISANISIQRRNVQWSLVKETLLKRDKF